MFIKKCVLLSLLWFNAVPIFAQIDDLLKNKNITWVAEISTDFYVDNPDLAEEKGTNSIRTLKLLPNLKVSGSDDRLEFSSIMLDVILKDKIPFYADSNCQNKIFAKALIRVDTISPCFSPEPTAYVISQVYEPTDFKAYRIRQILFYNAKTVQFGLRTLSFAPLINIFDEAGDSLGLRPLCWIKAEDIQRQPRLSSDAITWARLLSTRKSCEFNKAKILKKVSTDMPMVHFLTVAEKDSTKTFFSSDSHVDMKKMSFKDLRLVFFSVDTSNCQGIEPDLIYYQLESH
ncbi:MAG: hypothetical protein JNL70_00560 [Saprospiraceae bacterium]|nr:hypothetical protein [Saprospiraceae bacterium]